MDEGKGGMEKRAERQLAHLAWKPEISLLVTSYLCVSVSPSVKWG